MVSVAASQGGDLHPIEPVVVITGNYGSGKTEVAVNYALWLASLQEEKVQIADLDIVNPYFRSREAKNLLESHGVEVIVPEGEQFYSELPIILPQIRGMIQRGDHWAILDVGGDDHGARVLRHMRHFFQEGTYDLWLVLNANRPFTDSLEGALRLMSEIEGAAGLSLTGLIGNTHLMEETTPATLVEGHKLLQAVARKTELPALFTTVERSLLEAPELQEITTPLFPLERIMSPPWLRPALQPGRPLGVGR